MLTQLESKILDLQNQIQTTQAQIIDYQTNPAYVDFYYVCPICNKNNNKNKECAKKDLIHSLNLFKPRKMQFFTKTAELAQAQAQLSALQNELKTTQYQYEQVKESTKPSTDKSTTPTNPPTTISPEIDSILTPPPSKIQASIKVINAIDSLKQYLQMTS